MATYDAGTYFRYELDSGTTYDFLQQASAPPFTYDNSEADNTIEVGGNINSNTVVTPYPGTITLPFTGGGTVKTMVGDFSTIPTTQRILILPGGLDPANVTLPTSIDLNDLDTRDFVTCFAKGTFIATSGAARAVEDLRAGDEITTADGRQMAVK